MDNWLGISKRAMVVMAIVALMSLICLQLFPPHELYCVVDRNGELMKAWDADCRGSNVVGPVLAQKNE